MSLTQMQVFNDYIMKATIETLDQYLVAFNAASRGAIVLSPDGFTGDFLQESFFQTLAAAQRRVDRYAANGAAPITDLAELKNSSVKVAGGFGPVRYEPSQMTWLERPTAQGVEVASRAFAEILLKDQLNTAIAALVAAITAQSAAVNDVSATMGISQAALNNTHAKFGDASQNLVTQVMQGTTYHKLIGQALTNSEQLFHAGNVRVIDILGKVSVVTDAPALMQAGVDPTPNKEIILSLVQGAALVHDGRDLISNVQTSNGKERIETTLQVDYTFGVGLKGYTWDQTAGGKSPTDAELATGTNWDKTATSIKHTAGVALIGDASK
ncbi:MAG: major capsid protein [Pseudomonas sp.]|uniref:Major capsid protein n=1 Tax=Pseudomonas fragi TaxID=296 RepID=A0ABT4WLY3_PSEFR|nr:MULTISPECIES: major capsid protein [Pseudomonas]MDA7021065.1 major capsid protein [Pseudomonas fragi]MDN5390703.1 major capsid protein [Pseudomonas sp.]MDN5405325.1 major capsid protein [Pseudomonas sp.]MDN5452975.1 major capsid protein [Pseudomonas sp.]MDN5456857.1 major capsid protein [Pseudomonas sp.]